MPRNNYMEEVDAPTGYALDVSRSWWTVVAAEATINLLPDPSFELRSTAHAYITDNPVYCYMGQRGITATVADNKSYFNPRASGTHTFSAYVKATTADRATVRVNVKPVAGANIVNRDIRIEGNGHWVRINVQFSVSNAQIGTQFECSIDTVTVAACYTDCWQVEALPYATTYTDGDMRIVYPRSANEYYWEGEPYGSSSVRTHRTRSGGKIVAFEDFGFRTMSADGLGQPASELDLVTSARGRAFVRSSRQTQREFTIAGNIYGDSFDILWEKKRALDALFSPTVSGGKPEPIRITVQLLDSDEPMEIYAHFIEGLGVEINNRHQLKIALRFQTAETPNFQGEHVFAKFPLVSIENGRSIYKMNLDTGAWTTTAMPAGVIKAIDSDFAGNVYVGGTISGGVRKLDPPTSSSLVGTMVASNINDLSCSKLSPLTLAVCGSITSLNGVGTVTTVAYWDGATWTNIGRGTNGVVYSVLCHQYVIVVGGSFTTCTDTDGTVNSFGELACYHVPSGKWYEVCPNTQTLGTIRSLHLAGDGIVYASGVSAGGEAFTYWFNPSATLVPGLAMVSALESHIDNIGTEPYIGGTSISVGRDGALIGVGPDSGSTDGSILFMKSGAQWKVTNNFSYYSPAPQFSIKHGPDGTLYMAGQVREFHSETSFPYENYTSSFLYKLAPSVNAQGGVPLPIWGVDALNAPGGWTDRYTPVHLANGCVYSTPNKDAVNWYVANPITINYRGTAKTRVEISLRGPMRFYGIYNWTTKTQIVLRTPVTVGFGEHVTIFDEFGTLRKGSNSGSVYTPSSLDTYTAYSDITALDLYPGINYLSLMYIEAYTDSAYVSWREQFSGA